MRPAAAWYRARARVACQLTTVRVITTAGARRRATGSLRTWPPGKAAAWHWQLAQGHGATATQAGSEWSWPFLLPMPAPRLLVMPAASAVLPGGNLVSLRSG
jgi:hypothetical protein